MQRADATQHLANETAVRRAHIEEQVAHQQRNLIATLRTQRGGINKK